MVYYPSEVGMPTTKAGQVIYGWESPAAAEARSEALIGGAPYTPAPAVYVAPGVGAEEAGLTAAEVERLTTTGPMAGGIVGATSVLGGALGTLGLPVWLATLLAAGAGYLGYQALGGGEGAGLFGLDILGGPAGTVGGNGARVNGAGEVVGGVPLVGPFAAEPAAQYVEKEWRLNLGGNVCNFYLVRTARGYKVLMRNGRTGKYKWWTLPRPAVIGKNMPSHKMLTRLRRNLKKHAADARTIIQVASPTTYARWQGYKKPYRRRR